MSDIEAKREARRRRILENSGKRLQKITGVEERNGSYELEGYKPLETAEDPQIIENFVLQQELPIPIIHQNNSNIQNISFNTNLKSHRTLIIICIAIFGNVLITIFASNSAVNKIFIPLLCFEVIDLIYNKNNVANDSNLNLLMLFLNGNNLGWMLKYLRIFKTIFADVLLYFFIFVIVLYIKNYLLLLLLLIGS